MSTTATTALRRTTILPEIDFERLAAEIAALHCATCAHGFIHVHEVHEGAFFLWEMNDIALNK
jgi:hypothetical protein